MSEEKLDLSRFTDRARGVLRLATKNALRREVLEVFAFDLLRGIVEDDRGVGAAVLKNLGVFDGVKVGTESGVGGEVEYRKLPFSECAKLALQEARYAAESLGNNYVGTEHILIGLTLDLSFGPFVTVVLKLTHDKVLAEVKRLLGEWDKSRAETRKEVGEFVGVPLGGETAFQSKAEAFTAKAKATYHGFPVVVETHYAKAEEPRGIARRRLAIVRIGEHEILDAIRLIFNGAIGTAVYKAPWLDRLPKDAVIVRVGHDFATRQFELMLEHPSLAVVEDGAAPPILNDRFETMQTRFVTIKSFQDVDRIAELESENRRLRLELGKLVDERNAAKADEPITLSKEPSGSYVGATSTTRRTILTKDGVDYCEGDAVEFFFAGDEAYQRKWEIGYVSLDLVNGNPVIRYADGKLAGAALHRDQFVIRHHGDGP